MSEAVIHARHARPVRGAGEAIVARLNRLALSWLSGLEEAGQRRRDRRVLARMSDHDLADIGIGRSEIDRAVGS